MRSLAEGRELFWYSVKSKNAVVYKFLKKQKFSEIRIENSQDIKLHLFYEIFVRVIDLIMET